MLKLSTDFANHLLETAKGALSGNCQLHIFAGPVPASPADALDMAGQHTALATISADGNGGGLLFDTAANGVLGKSQSQTWSGTISFSGANASQSTQTPSFYRLCLSGDNGQGAGSGYRIQGTAAGPNSGADLQLATAQLQPGGNLPIGAFVLLFE